MQGNPPSDLVREQLELAIVEYVGWSSLAAHRCCFRPRRVQSAEGELSVEIPQVREAAEPFVSRLFPRGTKLLRTDTSVILNAPLPVARAATADPI